MDVLQKHSWLAIPFCAPRTERAVEVSVDTGAAIDIHVLPEDGRDEFFDKQAKSYTFYRERHDVEGPTTLGFTPDRSERWFLVFVNNGDRVAHVSYVVRW